MKSKADQLKYEGLSVENILVSKMWVRKQRKHPKQKASKMWYFRLFFFPEIKFDFKVMQLFLTLRY